MQMLWVNLIMDSLASLALATDTPTDDMLDLPPYRSAARPAPPRSVAVCSATPVKQIACSAVICVRFQGVQQCLAVARNPMRRQCAFRR